MWRTARQILTFTSARLRLALRLWTVAACALVLADLLAISLVAVSVSSLATGAAPAIDVPWSPGIGLVLAAVVLALRDLAALGVLRGTARTLAAIEIDVGGQLTDRYLTTNWMWLRSRDSNQAMRLAETGVSRVVGWFIKPLYTAIADVTGVIAIAVLVLVWDPAVGIAALTYGCLVALLLFRVLSPRVVDSGQVSFSAEHRMMQRVSQAWAAAAEIRVFGITGTFAEDVKQARAERARANAGAVVMSSAPQYLLELALVTGLGLLAAGLVAAGQAASVLTVVAVLAVAALRLLPAMLRLQSGLTTAKHNTVWAQALIAELEVLTTISAQARPVDAPQDGALLHLAGVGMQYEGRDQPTLSDVDLTLHPGDRIGVIGSSGSGKSTLAAIILGLIEPTAGTVRRTPVRSALLSQDAPVLAGTIRDNLVFARPWLADTPDHRLREVLAAAGLAEEIDGLPDGLDSEVGEAGRSLSGGQRQRLGLARALLDEPALLVLDEPTSQLDDENAQWVRSAIERLPDDVVVVFVTHRPQLLQGFERVLLVRNAHVVEVAGHEADRIRT